jgi:hypothetical protein
MKQQKKFDLIDFLKIISIFKKRIKFKEAIANIF